MHLVMFDVDGTLVDSSGFDDACYFATAKEVLGLELPTDWEQYTQATDSGILNEVIEKYGIQGDHTRIKLEFKRIFSNKISEYIKAHPGDVNEIRGAARFVEHLKSLGHVRVAVATGGWEEPARLKLRAAGINLTGCGFASSSDHDLRTGIMELAQTRTGKGLPFASKTYFGDAAWDKEASGRLCYRFVLVGGQIRHETRIDDYRDIDRIVSMLNL